MASNGEKAVVLDYNKPDDGRLGDVRAGKLIASSYYDFIDSMEAKYGRQRDFSVAKTELQQASMWLTRGLTNPE